VDAAFAPASDRFEGTLQSERVTVVFEGRTAIPAATKRVAKAARVVIPAIRLFDARLARTRFAGDLAAHVRALRSANDGLVAILAHLDVRSSESQLRLSGSPKKFEAVLPVRPLLLGAFVAAKPSPSGTGGPP